jgi:hypothetical protein
MTAVAMSAYYMLKAPATRATETSVGECQEKYCGEQIFVDRAINTLMRDDRAPSMNSIQSQLAATYRNSKRTLTEEAMQHPGVHLVAHTVL